MSRHRDFWTETEPVGTALPVLERAVEYFKGPSLEFGTGLFSTSLMTTLLAGVELHSFEHSELWHQEIKNKNFHTDPKHELHLVSSWSQGCNQCGHIEVVPDLVPFTKRRWSVIFADHGSHLRWIEIEAFRNICDVMVVHDADAQRKGGVNVMGNVRGNFTYYVEVPAPATVPHPNPSTVVASMRHDVSKYKWTYDE